MNSVITDIQKTETAAATQHGAEIECLNESKIEELFDVWKENGPAGLVNSNPIKSEAISDFMAISGMEVMPVVPAFFNRCYGRFVDINWGVVVLCLDDFDGVGSIYNKLRYFRDERPHIPVVLTSSDFKSNDLSQERLSICDLSIRLPLEPGSEESLFHAAGQNNMIWMERLAELEKARIAKLPKVQPKRLRRAGN